MLKTDLNLSKYYNAETRNVLTSCNYRFLTHPNQTQAEEIVVAPDALHEGELGNVGTCGTQSSV